MSKGRDGGREKREGGDRGKRGRRERGVGGKVGGRREWDRCREGVFHMYQLSHYANSHTLFVQRFRPWKDQ